MKRVDHVLEILAAVALIPIARVMRIAGACPPNALVVGWWGSETVGDVAILGQLLEDCREVAPATRVAVASFRPEVTQDTLRELDREDVRLLPMGIRSGWAAVASRSILFGGGPLMDSPSMPLWALKAWAARLAGARVMLYACGIGPVRWRSTRLAILFLLRAATHVVLRDEPSKRFFGRVLKEREATVVFDPAHDYVAGLCRSNEPRDPLQLALVLRFPTRAYLGARQKEETAAEHLLAAVAQALDRLSAWKPDLRLIGLVMHTGFAESDDHRVYTRLRERLDDPDRLRVAAGRHSVSHVAHGLARSAAALTVRFHGLVFALATRTPFVAIDYGGPDGKVRAAAERARAEGAVVAWDELEGSRLAEALLRAVERGDQAPRSGFGSGQQSRLTALASVLEGHPERQ